MANISSINGNPIVVGTDGLEDNAITGPKIADGAVSERTVDGGLIESLSGGRLSWEQGYISTQGIDYPSPITIRTKGKRWYPEGTNIKVWCDAGYKYAFVWYSTERGYFKANYWYGNVEDGFFGPTGMTVTDDLEVRFELRRVDEGEITPNESSAFHMEVYPPDRSDVARGNWGMGLIKTNGTNTDPLTYPYAMRTSWYYRFNGSPITVIVADGYACRMYEYEDNDSMTFVRRTDTMYDGTHALDTDASKMYRFHVYRTSSQGQMTTNEADDAFVVCSVPLTAGGGASQSDDEDGRLFLQLRHLKGDGNPKCVSLLHFSDIHGDSAALERIINQSNGVFSSVDDVICTGDIVDAQWSDDFGYWETAGASDVLIVMGNHDEIVDRGNWNLVSNYKTMAECYERYMSPFISGWGVTYQADKTYWYKDYGTSVRLIALDLVQDYLLHDDAQMAWFSQTLGAARAAGRSVVVAQHFPPHAREAVPDVGGWYDTNYSEAEYARWVPREEWQQAVEDFKDEGGEFVCWLGGHTHADLLCRNSHYPEQIFVNVDTATPLKAPRYSDTNRTVEAQTNDLFNIVAFDTVNKTLRILRIGASENMFMQSKKAICLNYVTGEVVGKL